jgi:hypothetical protein
VGDEGDFLDKLREMVAGERRYASFFEATDQQISEWGVAYTFAECSMSESGFPLRSLRRRGQGNDPPDCEAVDSHGHTMAIEVTELVDAHAVASAERGQLHWAIWNEEKVRKAIQTRLTAKDGKQLKGGPYEEYLVLVHSDEPGLSVSIVERSLAGHHFDAPARINRAFLLMSYDPAIRGYPYFPLRFRERAV